MNISDKILKTQPLVTVIVPVYQVEKYIHQCIDSILSQSYQTLEVILVDDGSTDTCPAICDDYATKDSRIMVIHQKNQGLSAARNIALDKMHGKYLAFVDGDDEIEENLIRYTVELCENNKLDAVTYKTILIDEQSNIIKNNLTYTNEYTELSAKKMCEMILTNQVGSQVWFGIYKSIYWENVRFPEGRFYEDLPTTFKAYANMTNYVAITNYRGYLYRKNTQGISLSDANRSKKNYHIFLGFSEQYAYACKHCSKEIQERCFANLSGAARGVMMLFTPKDKEYNEAKQLIKNNFKSIFANKYLSIVSKGKFIAITAFPFLLNFTKRYRKRKEAIHNEC